MSMIVGVDLSDATDRVVAVAEPLARNLDCEIVLVHVVAPEPDFVTYEAGPQHERDWRAAELRKRHSALDDLAARLQTRGITARPRLMEGDPIEKLLQEGERVEASMLIVGSHGHSLLYEVFVGSVAEGLIRRSTRPILIVPVKESS